MYSTDFVICDFSFPLQRVFTELEVMVEQQQNLNSTHAWVSQVETILFYLVIFLNYCMNWEMYEFKCLHNCKMSTLFDCGRNIGI